MRSFATPNAAPWTARTHVERRHEREQRSEFDIDRDRIIHSDSFRELQFKTQVQSPSITVNGGYAFRTRLNHCLEVAQLARGLARALGVSETLAETIALAHDLGHPPFGHAGERALGDALRARGLPAWNANLHSLEVVEQLECAFAAHRGLNLTWATREGIARHSTPFDIPASVGQFCETPSSGIEAQIVDVADVLAYVAHDLDDVLAIGLVDLESLVGHVPQLEGLAASARAAWDLEGMRTWPRADANVIVRRRLIATLIGHLMHDVVSTTTENLEAGFASPAAVRRGPRAVGTSQDAGALLRQLLDLLTAVYYGGPEVSEADRRAADFLVALFDRVESRSDLVPARFCRTGNAVDIAAYLASLNDFSARSVARELGVDAGVLAS